MEGKKVLTQENLEILIEEIITDWDCQRILIPQSVLTLKKVIAKNILNEISSGQVLKNEPMSFEEFCKKVNLDAGTKDNIEQRLNKNSYSYYLLGCEIQPTVKIEPVSFEEWHYETWVKPFMPDEIDETFKENLKEAFMAGQQNQTVNNKTL
jgi:hypothetical protein